ncbi:MAG: asparagine synthase (glutamine-hydrolyzing) [Planctomycetes bacterium]|jgi:asparagine synthase (glutamine-hydrolysing)|nr:asparagine synthase (glutamine-hydrolyzing) [Planctomycetota bacterium]
MCGIAGLLSLTGDVTAETITAMRETLRHRGPDDAGLWLADDGRVGLGHRRLSILDLSDRGHQPMLDPQGRAVIVYNGEVYNFAELRQELEAGGATFTSDTDTEVLLHGYLAWGDDVVDRLEGMFALAIWDTRQRRLLLVRDRLGIKPLVYAAGDDYLAFGSEIRAVRASGRPSDDLSPEAAWDFFSYGYVPTPATIYRDIRKLPPACRLTWRDGAIRIDRYWRPHVGRLGDDSTTASRRIAEIVDTSVERYLVADVPTGSYLSGGLDSSIVTQRAAEIVYGQAASHRLGGGALHSFTIGFDIDDHSEAPFARMAADAYGTQHHDMEVSGGMAMERHEEVVDLFDEPFAASSAIPMMFLAELARRDVTMALCGEGGDEVFGGYGWYRNWLRFQQPGFWKTAAGRAVRRTVEGLTRRPKRKWRRAGLADVELYASLIGTLAAGDRRKLFAPELAAHMAGRDPAAYVREHWREDLPPMARMQYVDLMTFLPDLNLARADRTSMNVSLELRVPLLNHELVDYALGLPTDVRTPRDELKGLFKRTFGGRLPEALRARRKKGFSSPVREWMSADALGQLAEAVFFERPDIARAWLSPDLPRQARRLRGSRAYKLWVMLDWLRRHG